MVGIKKGKFANLKKGFSNRADIFGESQLIDFKI